MQPNTTSTPCHTLSQAFLYFQKAWPQRERERMATKLLSVFKDNIPLFRPCDSVYLQEMAQKISQEDDHKPEIVSRMREIANRLTGYSPALPSHVFAHILSFLSLSERAGMHVCSKWFWTLAQDPSYLASIVHQADRPFPLDSLKKLLEKCGAHIVELDLARLLTAQERKNLTGTQLKELLALCPHLQCLTLIESNLLMASELETILAQFPQLKELVLAACRNIPNLDANSAAHPNLKISFSNLNGNQLAMAMSVVKRLRVFLNLPDNMKRELLDNVYLLHGLKQRGMSVSEFCSLDDRVRAYILQNSVTVEKLLKKMTLHQFATLSKEERNQVCDEISHQEDSQLYQSALDDLYDSYAYSSEQ